MKRFIPVICISALSLLLTSMFLPSFSEKAVKVSVQVTAMQKTKYQLFFCEGNEPFSEQYSMKKQSQENGKLETLDFSLPVRRLEKLRLDFDATQGEIVLSALSINGNPVQDFLELARQSQWSRIPVWEAKSDGIHFAINSKEGHIVFSPNFIQATEKRFYDILPLFSLWVLFYIAFYLMYRYMTNNLRQYKKADVIFFSFVGSLLILPALRMNFDENYIVDNRRANQFPHLWVENKLNGQYGKQFEDWFNDRFIGRKVFLKLYHKTEHVLNVSKIENTKAFVGKEDWLFFKLDNSVALYQRTANFSDDEMAMIEKNLAQQKAWFEEKGIRYYVFVAPNKEDVYGEYYRPGIQQADDRDRIQHLQDYLQNRQSNVDFCYPLDTLLAHKGDGLLYWKADTHWAPLGAYYGYERLMQPIQRDFPSLLVLQMQNMKKKEEKKTDGDLANMLQIKGKWENDTYINLEPADGYHYKKIFEETSPGGMRPDKIITVSPERPYKVLIFRDSFFSNLLPYVSETFGEVRYVWSYDIGKYRDEILNFQPDIVIVELVSRSGTRFLTPIPSLQGGE